MNKRIISVCSWSYEAIFRISEYNAFNMRLYHVGVNNLNQNVLWKVRKKGSLINVCVWRCILHCNAILSLEFIMPRHSRPFCNAGKQITAITFFQTDYFFLFSFEITRPAAKKVMPKRYSWYKQRTQFSCGFEIFILENCDQIIIFVTISREIHVNERMCQALVYTLHLIPIWKYSPHVFDTFFCYQLVRYFYSQDEYSFGNCVFIGNAQTESKWRKNVDIKILIG